MSPKAPVRRNRGRGFDVVEYAAQRSMSRAYLINPLIVFKAQLLNIEKPLTQARNQLSHYKEKLNIIRHQKNQCKTVALNCIDFFLANPNFLEFLD